MNIIVNIIASITAGLISGVVANYLHERFLYSRGRILNKFKKLLKEKDSWEFKDVSSNSNSRYCNIKDVRFSIEIEEKERFSDQGFFEPWYNKQDHDHGFVWKRVKLLFNGIPFGKEGNDSFEFLAVYLGKLFVPIPEHHSKPDSPYEIYYFWDKGALYYKVFELVGSLDIYKSVEDLLKSEQFRNVNLIEK